jgi:outer membrane lipoprotein LolB
MSAAPLSRRQGLVALLWGLALGGCASRPPAPSAAAPAFWSGRLLLKLDAAPPRQFSAGFELQGSAQAGRLRLAGPLGQTLAEARWSAAGAQLSRSGDADTEHYPDLDTLTQSLTGAVLPVAALFAWLAGLDHAEPGWTVDLTGLTEGRLQARRGAPAPVADLRLRLD